MSVFQYDENFDYDMAVAEIKRNTYLMSVDVRNWTPQSSSPILSMSKSFLNRPVGEKG